MVVLFVKSNENTYPKWRGLMQLYRVVRKTKQGNCQATHSSSYLLEFNNLNIRNTVLS